MMKFVITKKSECDISTLFKKVSWKLNNAVGKFISIITHDLQAKIKENKPDYL